MYDCVKLWLDSALTTRARCGFSCALGSHHPRSYLAQSLAVSLVFLVSMACLKATPVFTPNFDTVFKPSKVRICFLRTGKRKQLKKTSRGLPQVQKILDKLRKKAKKPCCKQKCLATMSEHFLQQAAQWQSSWIVTPRSHKRAALLAHMRRCFGPSQAEEHGTCHRDGRPHLVLTCDSKFKQHQHEFLGAHSCRSAFRVSTSISENCLSRAKQQAKRGSVSWVEKTVKRAAPRHNEMYEAVWILIKDLHLQSPFAGRKPGPPAADGKWHVPFHEKVGLWRMALKLFDGHSSVPGVRVFTMKPKYHTFKKTMQLPEIRKNVVFHRIVDIGRCPKCAYFQWKCSSVPVALRGIWQDALAKHHLNQLAQKRCYMADRARAAASFPHVELYMVFSSDATSYT